jgi:hypothetical protein
MPNQLTIPATLLALLTLSGCIVLPNGPQTSDGTYGAARNEVPTISQGEGGEWNARFSSNNCEVHYSQQGTRTQQTPACNSTQIQKADTGMAATRREQGL